MKRRLSTKKINKSMLNKEKIITTVKTSRFIYGAYYYVMSTFIKLLRLFVVPDNRLILFVSYGGRYYNDSPRSLYERMKEDSRYEGYNLVWAFRNPTDFPNIERKVKIDSFSYFVTALKACCWITNVHIERGLDFKGKKTFYFNTTHTLLPKVTGALVNKEATFLTKAKSKCDCYSVQCELERDILESEKEKVQIIGYPKSDILANYSESYRTNIRNKLGLQQNEIVILYAPTFREGSLSERPILVDFSKWKSILGQSYRVIFRAHPVFASKVAFDNNSDFILDLSNYEDNTELLIAADILVSDYSGIFFEFGIQDKPMFCYAYDYDAYIKERPLYFDIREELPGGYMKEAELLEYIKNGDRDVIMNKCKAFRSKYIQAYGKATETSLDIIYNNIQ